MASLKYTVDVDTRGARSSLASLEKSIVGLGSAVAGGFAVGNLIQFGDSIIGLQNKLRSLTSDQQLVNGMFNDITKIAGAARAPLQETGDLYFRIARAASDLGITQQQTASITESLAKSMSMTGASAQETSGALLQLGQALQSGRFQGDELRSVLENMPIVSKAMADELGVTIGELRKLGSEGKITSDVFVRAMEKNKKAIDDAFARSVPTAQQALNNLKTAFGVAMTEMAKEPGAGQALAGLGEAILNLSKDIPALTEAIKALVKVLGALAIAWAAFKGIALVTAGLNRLQAALLTTTSVFGAFKSGLKGIATSFTALITGTGKITAGFKRMGEAVTIGVRIRQVFFSLAAILGNVLRIAFRFAGWVGVLLAVGEALDYFLKKFFGFSIVDWAWKKISWLWNQLKAFAAWIGVYTPGPEKPAAAAPPAPKQDTSLFGTGNIKTPPATGGGGKSAKQTAKEQAEALRDVKNAILEVTAAYREQAATRLDDLKFQLQSLNMSEDQIQVEQNRRDILKEQKDALAQLATKEKEIKENKDLSNKGRKEALALIAQEKASIETATAAQLKDSEATIAAIQAKNRELERTNHLIDLQTKAAENKAALQNIEDQLKLVGLYGDKLDEVTAQIELQQKLRQIDVDAQSQLNELKKEEIKLGAELYAQRKQQIEDNKQSAIKAVTEQAAAQKKVDDAVKKSERTDVRAAIGKRMEELKRSVDPAITAVQGLNSVFDNMGRAIDDFVDTGKFKFGDFARSVVADIAKIALKAAATKILGGIFGGLFGIKLPGNAAGGPVMANKPYVVGEQGPELFVPNSAGSIMTNASLNKNVGQGGGAQPVVNNTYITNNISAIDSRSVAQMFVENRKALLGASVMARKEMPYGS